jgi:hypothetical protein
MYIGQHAFRHLRTFIRAALLASLTALAACGSGDDEPCQPTEQDCDGGGGGGGGGADSGGDAGQVADVVGSWKATHVESNPIPYRVNYNGFPSVITEAALGMSNDGTWEFYVYADATGQTGGGIGAGPMQVVDDYGTYTVRPQLDETGFTVVDFASQAHLGYKFFAGTDGQGMFFSYHMTTSASSLLVFDFQRR